MQCTDEQVERLKECAQDEYKYSEIRALIRRLEEAERALFSLKVMVRAMQEQHTPLLSEERIWLRGAEQALMKWRIVCGLK